MSTSSLTDTARPEADSPSSTDAAVADTSPTDTSTYPEDILDLLFSHISRDFTTRELVKLQRVSKSWKTLVSNHIPVAAQTRWEDDTKDWYFPLRFHIHLDDCKRTPIARPSSWLCSCGSAWTGSWTWSAVHHSSGEIHNLPPVLSGGGFQPHFDWLIASAGGLLLFMDKLPPRKHELGQPRASRLSEEACAAWLRQDRASFCTIDQVWRPLLVSNPLTKEWRILPAADPRDLGHAAWGYVGFRAHMVADEKANAYKVILTFRNFLLVYKSTSNCWTCRAFPEPTPWGFSPGFPPCPRKFSLGPSAIVGGKLYFAALEVSGNSTPLDAARDMDIRTFGCVKVYEIDEEAEIWKPPVRYELRNYILRNLRLYVHDRNLGFRVGSYGIGIVECMGSMYAIIPAILSIYATMDAECSRGSDLNNQDGDRRYYRYGYLPLQFYVLQLREGADLALGRLLMQIPYAGGGNHAESEYLRRMQSLVSYCGDFMAINPRKVPTKISTWFRCSARGSVIWVAFWDYLLQYDVVSGQSKTQILPDLSFFPPPDMSYSPSFHMKP